jgi:hypothetical protein
LLAATLYQGNPYTEMFYVLIGFIYMTTSFQKERFGDHIITEGEVWAHKTRLTLPLCIEVPPPNQESVLGILILPLSPIFYWILEMFHLFFFLLQISELFIYNIKH